MPSRKPRDPLEGAAPRLQPTARPISIPIGATPAPRRSPLAELAQAFDGFNQELKGALQDAAIKADRDAYTLGELEAQRQASAQRLGEIEVVAKELVDSGQLNKARSPAFKRGFSARTGRDLATGLFHLQLFARLNETTPVDGAKDPVAVAEEVRKEIAAGLPTGDLYAQEAFDTAAQASIQQFTQRSTEERLRNVEAAGEMRIADEGANILHQLAFVLDEEEEGTLLESYKAHLDTIRTELRKSDVNTFTMARSLKPVVDELIQEGSFDAAENLLQHIEDFDVTGEGGMLGKTAVGREILADLQGKISKERSYRISDKWQEVQQKSRTEVLGGRSDAGNTLAAIRSENAGNLPPGALKEALDNYRTQHGANIDRIVEFETQLERARKYDEGAADTAQGRALLARFDDGLSDEEADTMLLTLQGLADIGAASAEQVARAEAFVADLQDINTLVTEKDINLFSGDTFAETMSDGLRVPLLDLNAAHQAEADELSEIYDALSGDAQSQIVQQTTAKFREVLVSKLRAFGSRDERQAQRFGALEESKREARAWARMTLMAIRRKAQAEAQAPVPEPEKTKTTPREEAQAKAAEAVVPQEPSKPSNLDNRDAVRAWFRENFSLGHAGAFDRDWVDRAESDLRSRGTYSNLTADGFKDVVAKERAFRNKISTLADYNGLAGYAVEGSKDAQGYKDRLLRFATNLFEYGGAEYLTEEEIRSLGLDPEAFQNVGSAVN